MATRTLYVNRKDADTWKSAHEFCKTHNVSISQFVTDAIRWYLARLTE